MNIRTGIFVLAAALALAAPASAQLKQDSMMSYGPTPHNSSGGEDEEKHPVSHDSVALAQDLRLQGKCDEAVPLLRRLSERGAGYEISQLDLGLCLLDLAKKEPDAAKASDMRKEAASWIVKSANAGFAKAQSKAVVLYLDAVGVAGDPVEAEKWALLYHGNPMRFVINLPDISPDLSSRLDSQLDDAKRNEAQARANSWTATPPAADE
jgi:TPR repeat protein